MTNEPSRRSRLLRPSTLEPVELDLRKVIVAGIVTWLLALGVLLALTAADGREIGRGVAICVSGVALGLLGLVWERRHRRRTAR